MKDARTNQRARILNVLLSARGEWVPLAKITECAAQYNARVYELRRLGFRIVNRTRDIDGVRHLWFKLIPGGDRPDRAEVLVPPPEAGTAERRATISDSFREFGSLALKGIRADA